MIIENCRSNRETKFLTNKIKKISKIISGLNLKINVEKTKFMIIGKKKVDIKIMSKQIEKVNCFNYLGVWFDDNNTFTTIQKL